MLNFFFHSFVCSFVLIFTSRFSYSLSFAALHNSDFFSVYCCLICKRLNNITLYIRILTGCMLLFDLVVIIVIVVAFFTYFYYDFFRCVLSFSRFPPSHSLFHSAAISPFLNFCSVFISVWPCMWICFFCSFFRVFS